MGPDVEDGLWGTEGAFVEDCLTVHEELEKVGPEGCAGSGGSRVAEEKWSSNDCGW